ncbi:hypothetical protein ACJJTC_007675 [Scirpophaga incertulas]
MPQITFGNRVGRVVRRNNRTVVLFPARETTSAFQIASDALATIASACSENTPSYTISVDALRVGHSRGETADLEGALLASKFHRIVMYEDRGADLGFLIPHHQNTAASGTISAGDVPPSGEATPPVPTTKSPTPLQTTSHSCERILSALCVHSNPPRKTTYTATRTLTRVLSAPNLNLNLNLNLNPNVTSTSKRQRERDTPTYRGTLSGKPHYRPIREPDDYTINALVEFAALTRATLRDKAERCGEILTLYRRATMGMRISTRLLQEKLKKEGAAVYDGFGSQVLLGTMTGSYMAAYGDGCGFVQPSNADTNSVQTFTAAPGDPLLVVAESTRVMLESDILATLNRVAGKTKHFDTPRTHLPPCSTHSKPQNPYSNG